MIIGILISSGLVIFSSHKVKGGFNDDIWGIGLVMVSLLFDGFVGTQTDKNHKSKKRSFAYHTMLYSNTIGLVGNIIFYAMKYMMQGDSTL